MTTLTQTDEIPMIRRVSDRVHRIDWPGIGRRTGRLLRRLPLLILMALPYLFGYALRLVVRGAARAVWAVGWLAAWLFYTAAEGWAAAGSPEDSR